MESHKNKNRHYSGFAFGVRYFSPLHFIIFYFSLDFIPSIWNTMYLYILVWKKCPFELNHDDSLFTISIVSTSGRFCHLGIFCHFSHFLKNLFSKFFVLFWVTHLNLLTKKRVHKKNIIFIFAPTTTFLFTREIWCVSGLYYRICKQ